MKRRENNSKESKKEKKKTKTQRKLTARVITEMQVDPLWVEVVRCLRHVVLVEDLGDIGLRLVPSTRPTASPTCTSPSPSSLLHLLGLELRQGLKVYENSLEYRYKVRGRRKRKKERWRLGGIQETKFLPMTVYSLNCSSKVMQYDIVKKHFKHLPFNLQEHYNDFTIYL